MGWSLLREGTAHEHHQAQNLTFDGTLIDEMSFQMLASEDSSSTVVTATSAAKPTIVTRRLAAALLPLTINRGKHQITRDLQ